ncbi:MAG: histidine phosphatase family protein [Gammaproteobacteria bacterium]|nr:histidine phosphatase family protein [Gammaproteobacteria bacterium]
MAEIYCIRHGQASFAADDYDQLSDKGYRQGHLLGLHLVRMGKHLDRIYAGSLKRQIQTAEAVIAVYREHGLAVPDIEIDQRWNELETDQQVMVLAPQLPESGAEYQTLLRDSSHDKKALQKLIRATFNFWIENPELAPGLETWQAACQRVIDALTQVHRQNGRGSSAAVFTSGGIISIIAAHLLNLPSGDVYPLFEKVVNCSITQLVHNADSIALSTFNEHSYLQAIAHTTNDRNVITYR